MKTKIAKINNEIKMLKSVLKKELYEKKELIEKLINENKELHSSLDTSLLFNQNIIIADLNGFYNVYGYYNYYLCVAKYNDTYMLTICRFEELDVATLDEALEDANLDDLPNIVKSFDDILISLKEKKRFW